MRHTHYFSTLAEFLDAYENHYVEPWVSYCEESGTVISSIDEFTVYNSEWDMSNTYYYYGSFTDTLHGFNIDSSYTPDHSNHLEVYTGPDDVLFAVYGQPEVGDILGSGVSVYPIQIRPIEGMYMNLSKNWYHSDLAFQDFLDSLWVLDELYGAQEVTSVSGGTMTITNVMFNKK